MDSMPSTSLTVASRFLRSLFLFLELLTGIIVQESFKECLMAAIIP